MNRREEKRAYVLAESKEKNKFVCLRHCQTHLAINMGKAALSLFVSSQLRLVL